MYILIESWVCWTKCKEEPLDGDQRLICVCESLETLRAYMYAHADNFVNESGLTEYDRDDFHVHLGYQDELQHAEIDLCIETIGVLPTE